MTSRSVRTVTECVEQSEGDGAIIKRCLGEDVVSGISEIFFGSVEMSLPNKVFIENIDKSGGSGGGEQLQGLQLPPHFG